MRIIVIATTALLLSTAALAATHAEKRIARGFIHLGMKTRRAACYGAVIGHKLHGRDLAQAVRIVQSAKTSHDVRNGVEQSGMSVISAFTAAHSRCDKQTAAH